MPRPTVAKNDQKQQVLTKGSPSVTRKISDAVIIKEGDPFFLTLPNGDVPLEPGHGFGLYFNDCRYLCGYELRIEGLNPTPLVANADLGYRAIYELSNPDLRSIPKDTIGIQWLRRIDGQHLLLKDVLNFQNFSLEQIAFRISFRFAADFADIFAVRELLKKHPGKLHAPKWRNHSLHFLYEGADRIFRTVAIHFDPLPAETEEAAAHFDLNLAARETKALSICIVLAESSDSQKVQHQRGAPNDWHRLEIDKEPHFEEWRKSHTQIESNSILLNQIVDRSLRDLWTLRSSIDGESFFAAGIPWFATLFGRDSLITAIQTLAYNPELAAETLRLLAKYQGTKVDDWKDEQPGKILHELRIGELANIGEIPHTPYYGSIDSTPLFLISLGLYGLWTGDLNLFHELREPVDRALSWISKYGDADHDGYVEYQSTSPKGLINQGWKDSGDAIVNKDGSLARSPIALVEIQSYVYMAKQLLAELFIRDGSKAAGERLRHEANELRERFNRDYWMADAQFFALALEANKEQVSIISSNPGHALWAGIAEEDKAKKIADRLMQDDIFNGWGIRTISEREVRYNPLGYHLGTAWPHDNSIIAAGFRAYGFDQYARKIVTSMMEAAMEFLGYRLPEVFAGFHRKDYQVPVHYPVACHPQAWAAGTVPFMVTSLLGLQPNAFDRKLRIVRPMLPEFVDSLAVRKLRVADARVDLQFTKLNDEGYAHVDVLEVHGDLKVENGL